jgi:methionyl-tRNA formyltransferase
MDAGDVYLQARCGIESADTTATLAGKLSRLGAPLLRETVDRIHRNDIRALPQDAARATYAPKLKKEHGLINWSLSADRIARQVRAFDPWPGSYSRLESHQIKIWRAQPVEKGTSAPQGVVIEIDAESMLVACGGASALRVLEVQPENRGRMSAADFARGARLGAGSSFNGK